MTEQEIKHRQPVGSEVVGKNAFTKKKPNTGKSEKADDDDEGDSISQPMSENNFPTKEESEVMFDEKGDIIGEKLRADVPR